MIKKRTYKQTNIEQSFDYVAISKVPVYFVFSLLSTNTDHTTSYLTWENGKKEAIYYLVFDIS